MDEPSTGYRGPLAEPLPADEPTTTRRSWHAERLGWALVALLVLVSALGVLGHGPLSWDQAQSTGGGVVLDYQRMARHNADEQLRLELGAETVQDGTIDVELRGPWVHSVRVDAFVPEPSAQRTLPDGMLLEFEVEDTGPTAVTLYYRAFRYGAQEGEVAVGEDRLRFTQWILP